MAIYELASNLADNHANVNQSDGAEVYAAILGRGSRNTETLEFPWMVTADLSP